MASIGGVALVARLRLTVRVSDLRAQGRAARDDRAAGPHLGHAQPGTAAGTLQPLPLVYAPLCVDGVSYSEGLLGLRCSAAFRRAG